MTTPRRGTPVIGNEPFDVDTQQRVIELWGRRVPVAGIASQLGIKAWSVDKYIHRWLRSVGTPDAERRRKQENLALDELERAAWRIVVHPGYQVGVSVQIPMNAVPDEGRPMPLEDNGRRLEALRTLVRIHERRARLNGLDAPKRANISPTLAQALAAVELLEREADRSEVTSMAERN